MKINGVKFNEFDVNASEWMARNGILFLRIAIGIIFIWFGAMKFFKDMSPAEVLAVKTIDKLVMQLINHEVIRYGLAVFEVLLGLGLMFRLFLRTTLLLLFVHMLGTFSPLFLFPEEIFSKFPFYLTLEGQYIVKNIVIIAGGIVIGATIRGGGLKSSPNSNQESH